MSHEIYRNMHTIALNMQAIALNMQTIAMQLNSRNRKGYPVEISDVPHHNEKKDQNVDQSDTDWNEKQLLFGYTVLRGVALDNIYQAAINGDERKVWDLLETLWLAGAIGILPDRNRPSNERLIGEIRMLKQLTDHVELCQKANNSEAVGYVVEQRMNKWYEILDMLELKETVK